MFAFVRRHKAELHRKPAVPVDNAGHGKGLDDLTITTCAWLSRFIDERLHGELDDRTPVEMVADYGDTDRAKAVEITTFKAIKNPRPIQKLPTASATRSLWRVRSRAGPPQRARVGPPLGPPHLDLHQHTLAIELHPAEIAVSTLDAQDIVVKQAGSVLAEILPLSRLPPTDLQSSSHSLDHHTAPRLVP